MGTKTQKLSNVVDQIVEWQAVFTGDGSTGLTAVAGRGYFIDTTSGTVTVTLPASPKVGDIVQLKDYARTWGTNAVSIASALFDGDTVTNDFSTNGQTVTLVYMDGTKGWSLINEDTTSTLGASFIAATGGTVTTSGDYKIHTFTGDGCFVVSCAGNAAGSNTVDYLVVAGGGSGGVGTTTPAAGGSGGGGAGGYRESSGTASGCYTVSPLGACVPALPVTATTYPITVGGGGTAPSPGSGNPGSNSVFSTITSAGGGDGACAGYTAYGNGASGGSGGGGGSGGSPGSGTGCAGAGNTPPVSPPQGQPGGQVGPGPAIRQAGGGGGATQAGVSIPTAVPDATTGGDGGDGAGTAINPSPTVGTPGPNGALRYFAGGGAAGTGLGMPTGPNSGGVGGGGGPGRADDDQGAGVPGTANTGGGGGGNTDSPNPDYSGGNGGKGIVIIRYKFQ